MRVALPNINYKGPHRVTTKKRMTTLYRLYRQALIDKLSCVTDIALTADCWSSPRRTHLYALQRIIMIKNLDTYLK